MNRTLASTPPRSVVLPTLASQASPAVKAAFVIGGTAVLAASSWIQVPMVPVPMTLQTLAVPLIGALLGARLGTLTVLAWLAESVLGLPVLAEGGGVVHLFGPTAGYLASFVVTAALVGWLSERGMLRSGPRVLAAMLLANALILVMGAAWLAHLNGVPAAVAHGITPFLLGGLVKAGLATAVMRALAKAEPAGLPRI